MYKNGLYTSIFMLVCAQLPKDNNYNNFGIYNKHL